MLADEAIMIKKQYTNNYNTDTKKVEIFSQITQIYIDTHSSL